MNLTEFESLLSPEPNNGCWLWIGGTTKGYGALNRRLHGESYAHRLAYRLFVGPIPKGKCVLHRCDNPPCCNPAHLFLGTRGDNARDMASKGRQWLQRDVEQRAAAVARLRSVVPFGAQIHNTKLTEAMVVEIRKRRAAGETHRAIARAIGGITYGAVAGVVSGRTWSHIPNRRRN